LGDFFFYDGFEFVGAFEMKEKQREEIVVVSMKMYTFLLLR
jgi:hypothetical protein